MFEQYPEDLWSGYTGHQKPIWEKQIWPLEGKLSVQNVSHSRTSVIWTQVLELQNDCSIKVVTKIVYQSFLC